MNMKKRILITGTSGLLGSNLVLALREAFTILGTDLCPADPDEVDTEQLDITSPESVRALVSRFEPQVIIHCAAETRVDHCEEHPEEAYRTNVEGTSILASAGAAVNAKMIYISTDSVFDGNRGHYQENDETHPMNIYAQTKLSGERAVERECADHLILRTNMFGWNRLSKLSLAEWVLDRVENDPQKVPGFTDIIFSPLVVNHIGHIIQDMIQKDLRGLYHAAARNKCSKYDFARMVCDVFGKNPDRIYAARSDDFSFKAPRPKDTSLAVAKITAALEKPMPSVLEGIRYFRRLLDHGYVDRLRSKKTNKGVRT